MVSGQDVMCKSRTGSGKTLAFAIPIVESLNRQVGLFERATLAQSSECSGFFRMWCRYSLPALLAEKPRTQVTAPVRIHEEQSM